MNSNIILKSFTACTLSVLLAIIAMSCNERLVYLEESKFVIDPPTLDPPAAIFTTDQTVRLKTDDPDALIRYTLDGSKPDENSILYADSLYLTDSVHIRAITVKEGYNNSRVTDGFYSLSSFEMVFAEGSALDLIIGELTIVLSDFFIGKYEVTQAEFAAVMGFNPSDFQGKPEHPVERVSWFDAIEFCNRLSIAEGLTPCYSYGSYGTNPDDWPHNWNLTYRNSRRVSCDFKADGYRLPTYIEWFYAASGGKPALQQGTFFNEYGVLKTNQGIGDYAWYSGNSHTGEGRSTQPVGMKKPNEMGLHDMMGNVENWCWDGSEGMYIDQMKGTITDPAFDSGSDYRIFAGGNWASPASRLSLYSVWAVVPDMTSNQIGFRIARRLTH